MFDFNGLIYNEGVALLGMRCPKQAPPVDSIGFVNHVVGVDEAGRGPLLGPVAVAAVILDERKPIHGLTDSKKLSEKKRETLFQLIIQNALAYSMVFISPEKIDDINILQATLLGMRSAADALLPFGTSVLVDGNKRIDVSVPCEAVVDGDALHPEISAASILAKVSRDHYMYHLHAQFPDFAIDRHKGYPTKLHREVIEKYGVLPEHRRSFKPIRQMLANSL